MYRRGRPEASCSSPAPAEPDLGLGNGPFALLRLRAYLRTMLTDSTVSMASASVDGRSVYVLRAKVITATGVFMGHEPPQPLTIVIDAATRLPLTYQWSQFGMTWEARFDMSTGDKAPERSLFCLLYTSPSPRDRTRSRMP